MKKDVKILSPLDVRIPEWNMESLFERRCPFCNFDGECKFTRPDKLIIKYCNNCDSFYISPTPGGSELNKFYSNYFRHFLKGYKLTSVNKRQILASEPFEDLRIKEIHSLIDIKGKNILDVGFGKGETLVRFKKLGANIFGIELDQDAIEFVRTQLDIPTVIRSQIEDIDSSDKYDLIVLNDLIEHPLYPMSIITKVRDILNDNGLMSLWTPNASSGLEDNDPILFRVDFEHMQYLSFNTCYHIARKFGFDIVHIESIGFPVVENIEKFSGIKKNTIYSEILKFLSTFKTIKKLNEAKKVLLSYPDIRYGRYNLFCIFKKKSIIRR